MSIVMNMSNYEIERNSMEAEYNEEIMYAGWNPAVALVDTQLLAVTANRPAPMPTDIAIADANLFLQKMYEYQR